MNTENTLMANWFLRILKKNERENEKIHLFENG